MRIDLDDPRRPDAAALLDEHLADMRTVSPPDSCHALPADALAAEDVTFWTARDDGRLLGFGALKRLDARHGEIKSMRTTAAARGQGVGTALLRHVVAEARGRGYVRLSLETGAQDYFEAARILYSRHGFEVCPPFGDYVLDPNSVYMTMALEPGPVGVEAGQHQR